MSTSTRVALLTGGAGGIATAIVERLLAAQVRVVIADVDQAAAERSAASFGKNVTGLRVDVTDESSVALLFEAFDRDHERLDILINCAGVSPRVNGERPFVVETPLEVWQRTLAINLTGTFLVCRAAVPRLVENRWGRIVNLASLAGRSLGEVTSCYYAASKSGVIGFSRVLARELGQHGITVNCVSPSRVATAMARNLNASAAIDQLYIGKTPMGRIGAPQDVAAAVMYLVSEDASFVTGAILDITGGYYMP
ncbi:MAG TPA: SDR family NAD(P)-dependent oxidoreductase [Steroidobacteraceae bacterium]|nr:SDR family NAD(P)-dependent oxidoreductase [Steroidobacteraceae bacterium]